MVLRTLFIFGTRPEAIKLAPLIRLMRTMADHFEVSVCVTGQHRSMLDQVLSLFDIRPDVDLDIMTPNQDLTDVTTAVLTRLRPVIAAESPHWLVVQGDTTTTMAASLAGFYGRIPVAHVEAGLRTFNRLAPWPEEMNRVVTSNIAELHFAPTELSRQNLLRQGVPVSTVHVTGNTVVDALLQTVERLESDAAIQEELRKQFAFLHPQRKLILVTGHRRENFGEGFESICHALADVVRMHEDVEIIYPVHLNPNVQEPVRRILGDSSVGVAARIHLVEPVDYVPIVFLMKRAYLILTDSGGIQEEAPSLGKPVLVMRETTERPEAVDAGTVRLVGTDRRLIVEETTRLLIDGDHYRDMSRAHNPYGDGRSSMRIASIMSHLPRL